MVHATGRDGFERGGDRGNTRAANRSSVKARPINILADNRAGFAYIYGQPTLSLARAIRGDEFADVPSFGDVGDSDTPTHGLARCILDV